MRAAREALNGNRGESSKVRASLRQVTGLEGYQYLKDIAYGMADVLMAQIPESKSDNRSQVGAIYRQAFLRLFTAVEKKAALAPKTEVENLIVERYTETDPL